MRPYIAPFNRTFEIVVEDATIMRMQHFPCLHAGDNVAVNWRNAAEQNERKISLPGKVLRRMSERIDTTARIHAVEPV